MCVKIRKDPLLPEDLVAIFKVVNLQSHVERLVWIGVLICFRALVRKCHVFST